MTLVIKANICCNKFWTFNYALCLPVCVKENAKNKDKRSTINESFLQTIERKEIPSDLHASVVLLLSEEFYSTVTDLAKLRG